MRIIFTVLFTVLFISFSKAQIKDSLKVKNYPVKGIDLLIDDFKIDTIRFDEVPKSNMVYINKKLLESLLKPYYIISIDPITNDTVFSTRYRMVTNPINNDTSYVSKPKTKKYIAPKMKYGIDTLVIENPFVNVVIEKPSQVKDPEWWKNKNSIGLDINEAAFMNWSAGGNNTVSGLLKIYFGTTYEDRYMLWNSEISARYGLNQQEEKGLRKTDDELKLSSTFGYRKDTITNWYYSVKLNFNTQFTDGFKYPNTDQPISRFFAPAYLFVGAGAQYNLKEKSFSVYLSPLTLKSTFVLDDNLSNEGAFGVDEGKNSRNQFGALIQGSWDTEVFKNVAMSNRLSLYSDYLNNFGNIDVDWALDFRFKINTFLEASFGTHLIYDDDIKYKEDTNDDGELETFGPKVQLKQQLGIGLIYKF
ncbi:MAG: DUF3078 domain-containing protein [Bacteroidota bacterium]